jgi:outer membrane protein
MKRVAVILALAFASCAHDVRQTLLSVAPNPSTPWVPPVNAVPPVEQTRVSVPQIQHDSTLTLPQIIDIALANNPQTRSAWLNARAAQQGVGIAQSAYLPEVDLTVGASRSRVASAGGSSSSTTTVLGPSLALSYLLFDFGGRAADVEQARQTLIAADFLHNQAIQDVVLRAEQAYYDYLDAKALLAAQTATLAERRAQLDAAEARHNAGVATIADVLQARTAYSQAQLNLESIQGQLRTIEGVLATTMGLPATAQFTFGDLPLDVPSQQVTGQVGELIDRAVASRPDLAAARAEAERARARITAVRSEYRPSVGVTSSIGQTWFGTSRTQTPASAGVALRFPVFTGFRNVYDVRQAEIEADLARENVRSVEEQVNLQVWTSYYALQTATQRLATAKDLLASATQSADVAQNRYKSGVGNILDVLTAQSALESARAQEVQARADWFLAVAQLAHDTGTLTQETTR